MHSNHPGGLVVDVTYIQCTSIQAGSGLAIFALDITEIYTTVLRNTFISCRIDEEIEIEIPHTGGGALIIYNSQSVHGVRWVSVLDSSFYDCSGRYGGGIYLEYAFDILIKNSSFVECGLRSGGGFIDAQGGGVSFSSYGARLQIEDSSFVNCHSQSGGAIYIGEEVDAVILRNNRVVNCTAINGGAIAFTTNTFDIRYVSTS